MTDKPLGLRAIRHMLASIDLSDVEEKDMDESERKEYVAAISAVWPRLEKDIRRFLHAQLMFIANEAQDMNHVAFGRGTFNGMDLLLNHWKKAADEHNSKLQEKEKFDKHSPMGEI